MTQNNNNNNSRNDADTYGWDATFAINFANANTALRNGWSNVNDKAKQLNQAASDAPSYSVTGLFDPWQLTLGGDGKNIRLACPLRSGTYQAGGSSFDLAPKDGKVVQVVIEVGMEWVPDPGQFAFVIAGNSEVDAITTALNHPPTVPEQLATEFKNHGVTLSASAHTSVIKTNLEWYIVDGKDDYYIFHQVDKQADKFLNIYRFEDAWKNNLKVLAGEVGQQEPAVNIITIENNPTEGGIAGAVLPELLSVWFNTNIGELNYVFAILDLSVQVDQSDKWQWMKPTATSYAVIDQGTIESSIFGVLTMVGNRTPSDNHQVSPNAIPTGSDANGANAGFLISGPLFLKNMMLAGAQEIFNGATLDSFEITNDGLTIQNTQDLVWGKFMMDNKLNFHFTDDNNYAGDLDAGDLSQNLQQVFQSYGCSIAGFKVAVTTKGNQWLLTSSDDKTEYILNKVDANIEVYDATVIKMPKGQFQMSLNHTWVEIKFIDLTYPYSDSFDVHINYTEQVELGLKKDQDGKPILNNKGQQVFWYNQTLKNMTVNITKTQAAITREIVEGAVAGVLSLVAVAGPIIEGLSASAEIGEVTEEGGSALIDEEAFTKVEEEDPEAVEENEEDAGEKASGQSSGKLTAIKNAFSTPKWKFMGALAGLAGAVAGFDQAVSAIIEDVAKNQWENVPGFDDFANLAISPCTWPGVEAFTLQSSWLAGSLQIGLKTK